jgi:hypothetical protein
MDFSVVVERGDGLGPDDRGLDDGFDHCPAEISLRHDAVGGMPIEGVDYHAAPSGRRRLHAAVLEESAAGVAGPLTTSTPLNEQAQAAVRVRVSWVNAGQG